MKKPVIYLVGIGLLGVCAAVITRAMPTRPQSVDNQSITTKIATTRPGDSPTTRSVVRPMPPEYRILQKRSMFARQAVPLPVPVVDTQSETARIDLQTYSLRGVASQDGTYIAFVEQSSENTMLRLRAGDQVARGRVSEITLRGVEYEAGGQVTHVEIGCRLDGTRPEATTQSTDSEESKSSQKKKPTGSGDATPSGGARAGESREKAK